MKKTSGITKVRMLLARLAQALDKKVQPQSFQVSNQVLALKRPIITTHKTRGKLIPKWQGPHVVYETYMNGAYKVVNGEV